MQLGGPALQQRHAALDVLQHLKARLAALGQQQQLDLVERGRRRRHQVVAQALGVDVEAADDVGDLHALELVSPLALAVQVAAYLAQRFGLLAVLVEVPGATKVVHLPAGGR
eukprot:353590-Chlamydomonas_euryale.AAC.17